MQRKYIVRLSSTERETLRLWFEGFAVRARKFVGRRSF
jgi:hypothetical protein